VHPDLGPPPPDPEHQVGAGTDRREFGQPDVLKDAEDAQLALLVDQGVVGRQREVEVQVRTPGWN
jgi:hypothetical protein